MSRSYDLDPNAAKKADEKSARINATGAYIGELKNAIAVRSGQKGTEGVELHFESLDKQEARVTIWTFKADGTQLSGFNTVQAIMTCLQIRRLEASPAKVELYDREAGAMKVKEVDQYHEMIKKPLGLLLQLAPEEYVKGDGSVATVNKLDLYGVFNPASKMVASEILARAVKPEKLEKMQAMLKDRPLKRVRGTSAGSSPNGPAPTGGLDDFEDDIPF